MTRRLRFICLLFSIGLLVAAYFLGGLDWVALGVLGFGIVWTIGLALRWSWIPSLAFFASYLSAAVGFLLDLSPFYLIPAAVFALLAWDLTGFVDRLRLASPGDDISSLEKRHLVRLLPLALIAVSFSAVALAMHLKPSLEWMIILVFFLVWAIGQVVGLLQKRDA